MELENDEDGNPKIKVILVGEAGVGKTNLINVTTDKNFNENERSTISASFSRKIIDLNKKSYNLYLWDTMGQEKLKSLTKIFFKNSKIVVLVFDITQEDSFRKLSYWHDEVKESLGNDIIIGICGNKSDLFLEEKVSEEECQKYAKEINAKFVYTSAKMDKSGFTRFLKILLNDFVEIYEKKMAEHKKETKVEEVVTPNIVLQKSTKQQKKKKKSSC